MKQLNTSSLAPRKKAHDAHSFRIVMSGFATFHGSLQCGAFPSEEEGLIDPSVPQQGCEEVVRTVWGEPRSDHCNELMLRAGVVTVVELSRVERKAPLE